MTKRILRNIVLLLAALAVLAAPALAQGHGHGNGNGEGNGRGKGRGDKHEGNRMDREKDNEDQGEVRDERGGRNKHRMDRENDNEAQDENRDERSGRNVYRNGRRQVGDQRGVTVFGPRDRDIISGYYRNQYSNLPPGLAKRGGNLPPGLERQLERNGTLPPGLQRRVQPFPAGLNSQLSPLPRYYTRGVIGNSVVVYNTRTRLIVDVIRNILNR